MSPASVVLISPEAMQAKVAVIMDLNSASILPHSVLAFALLLARGSDHHMLLPFLLSQVIWGVHTLDSNK